MAKHAEIYAKLFSDYRAVEAEMADRQPDRQRDLLSKARAIVRFEIEHDLPKLRELVTTHRSAVAQIEAATAKLNRLVGVITNQENYIIGRFSGCDTTGDCLDLIGWRESETLGRKAVELLRGRVAELEGQLRELVKERKGISECLEIERQKGWNKSERENFAWLAREIAKERPSKEAA